MDIVENTELQNTVAKLINLIDRFDADFKRARDLIVEIARKIEKSEICEGHQICRHIKELLRNKIREGKISSKWIEESLPKEYKREYNKSELSSLSNKKENVVVENCNVVLMKKLREGNDQCNDDVPKNVEFTKNNDEHPVNPRDEEQEINDLIVTERTENVLAKFVIKKVQKELIVESLERCKQFCFLKFDRVGILDEVTPDYSMEVP